MSDITNQQLYQQLAQLLTAKFAEQDARIDDKFAEQDKKIDNIDAKIDALANAVADMFAHQTGMLASKTELAQSEARMTQRHNGFRSAIAKAASA